MRCFNTGIVLKFEFILNSIGLIHIFLYKIPNTPQCLGILYCVLQCFLKICGPPQCELLCRQLWLQFCYNVSVISLICNFLILFVNWRYEAQPLHRCNRQRRNPSCNKVCQCNSSMSFWHVRKLMLSKSVVEQWCNVFFRSLFLFCAVRWIPL